MSQERWDVVLKFLNGPRAGQPEVVAHGPVVRLGANPGPGGVSLQGYRGLDDRQAVITAYDGGTVAIAAVGGNQVRLSTHAPPDWSEIPPIREPQYLSPGDCVHLGPPGRGCTAVFVACQRLGTWEQQRVLSEAAQGSVDPQPTQVEELDASQGVPWWFLLGLPLVVVVTAIAVVVPLIQENRRQIAALGPVDEGLESYDFVDASVVVDAELEAGLEQPFRAFVMAPNAEVAGWERLANDEALWDARLFDYVTRSVQVHAQGWRFWRRLENVKDDYAFVVDELREADLPEVLAAIPYQESQYRLRDQSPACAMGPWQLMPETAHRMELDVRDCALKGSNSLFSPSRTIPVLGVMKNAPYVDPASQTCRITGCAVDDRTSLPRSTRAAVLLLEEAWQDPEIQSSGAAIQLTIASHNAGYDDGRFEEQRQKPLNILPALRRHRDRVGADQVPDIIGQNLLCASPAAQEVTCGGVLHRETQHYVYNVIAQHLLAVCYYATNHDKVPAFSAWKDYVRPGGYCLQLQIPTSEQVIAGVGK